MFNNNLFENNLSTEKKKNISLSPVGCFHPKVTEFFNSKILDKDSNSDVGEIYFQLKEKTKTIIVQSIDIDIKKEGYGVAVYKMISEMYPDFTLVSSSEIAKKDSADQEKPNAIYLWDKLVSLGYAEKDELTGIYKMKK